MADIKLVIKIPEEIYKASQIIDVKYEDVIQIPLEVVAHGTPLPKGHGRIGDLDALRCENTDFDKYEEPTTKNDLGVDCISRQAVLDLIADYDLSMGQVVRGIHALPSVTPQTRKGHWVLRNSFLVPYKCSECNYESERYDNFCPNCGSDNREVDE